MSFRPFYSGHEFLQAATAQRNELSAAFNETERLRQIHVGRRTEIEAQTRRALGELLVAILPEWTPEALARAAALTGYVMLTHPGVYDAAEAERRTLVDRLAVLEADPRFANRELLRAPRVGTLTRAIEELLQFRAPLAAVLEQATHPRLEHLLAIGYGTEAYEGRFWRVSYYADWEAGDAILERFSDKKAFCEVREEVLRAREAVSVYDARLAELRAEWAAGQALDEEHARLRAALPTLVQRHLENARRQIAQYLESSDLAVVGPRLAADPGIELMAKRWSGLAHKLLYIDRLTAAELDSMAFTLGAAIQKLDRDISKLRSPKKLYRQYPGEAFERRFRSRWDRYGKTWQRYTRAYDAVYGFERYDAARMAADFLWWDLMTDGRIDGDMIPEVRAFHASYPGHRGPYYRHDDDDDLEVAAAAASASFGHSAPDRFTDAS